MPKQRLTVLVVMYCGNFIEAFCFQLQTEKPGIMRSELGEVIAAQLKEDYPLYLDDIQAVNAELWTERGEVLTNQSWRT